MKIMTNGTEKNKIINDISDTKSTLWFVKQSYNISSNKRILSNKINNTNDSIITQDDLKQYLREREYYESTIKERAEIMLSHFRPNEKFSLDELNWKNLSTEQKRHLVVDEIGQIFPILRPNLIKLITAGLYYGDCCRSPDERPDWLDLDKFRRGQKFAQDHALGVNICLFISIFILMSFNQGVKPIISTGKSSTPFTSFRRFLRSTVNIRNWYTSDPFEPGTLAYNDMQSVRKSHSKIRTRLLNMSKDEFIKASTIDNPMCPLMNILVEDLREACPASLTEQCPYRPVEKNLDVIKGLNQADMVSTQFGFIGLILLYPKAFGIHNITEEDLDAFCYTWKVFGYLLGIDDYFNFCSGTLNEIRDKCRDFLDLWVKQNFREITPHWEHMTACVVEGVSYYFPLSSYKVLFLYLTDIMDLRMPRLFSTLTYTEWFTFKFLKFSAYYLLQIPVLETFLNKLLNYQIDKYYNLNTKELLKLMKKSKQTLKNWEEQDKAV